jgi:hypothetical protein
MRMMQASSMERLNASLVRVKKETLMSWEIIYPIGALLVLAAIAYGAIQYKTRNRANDRVTEEATREQYAHPETYNDRREELKKKLRPS